MICPSGKRALRRIQSFGCQIKRVYRCELCGEFHTTSQPKEQH